MNRRRLHTFLFPALCLLCGAARASDLELDGRVSVVKLMGSVLQVTVRGGANLPVTLFIDTGAGPSTHFGITFPLGFTPSLGVIPLGTTDVNGDLTVSVTLPSAPGIHLTTIHAMAVISDPTFPMGLDVSNGADLTLLDRDVNLAGHSLGQFPFFQHVAAFNEGSTLELGIDPSRFPAIVGRTADIYVVASKTRAQWITNGTLSDVTGRPQTVMFSGWTIQTNTFTIDTGTLSGPDAAPGSGDTRVGVPYDLVIDFNQDGILNGDDLIDGYDDSRAGFYVVRDLTLGGTKTNPNAGPLAVSEIKYDLGSLFQPVGCFSPPCAWLKQNTYYPTDIATMGKLPLIVISHGNGHDYQWYDHLGYHLASFGYVVMSHSNNTGPGSHTAATTTLDNTDGILAAQASIQGGVLDGHIDETDIMWIGHSRGGDGVVRAYDRLVDGTYTPLNYTRAGIKLVSSIAPVNFGGFASSNPHGASFHLWVGQADTDVNGCACSNTAQPYQLHDRATGSRQSISIYGAGHDDFHDAVTFRYRSGPCLIDKANTHAIMRGHVLPLVKFHFEDDEPSMDFLWRQYDTFRPIGAPTGPCITVNLMFQEGASTGKLVIDDFDTNPDPSLASSGATVSKTTEDFVEGKLDDANNGFAFNVSDPFNGFTMAGDPDDTSRGIVFTYTNRDADITYTSLPRHDFVNYKYLQFRAAQGTRAPQTIAELADLTFTVKLVDGSGLSSSINIGAYGGGIEEPYQRNTNPLICSPCAAGTRGWNSDFETIRIPVIDFLNNGNSINLVDIQRLVFEFGPSFGSAEGYVGLDEIELVKR